MKNKFKEPLIGANGRKPIRISKRDMKICALEDCGKPFIPKNAVQKYCSARCSNIISHRMTEKSREAKHREYKTE